MAIFPLLKGIVASVAIVMMHFSAFTTADIRTYFIAAEEVVWNYLPIGKDCMHGLVIDTNDGNFTAPFGCPAKSNHSRTTHDQDTADDHHMTGHSTKFTTQGQIHGVLGGDASDAEVNRHAPEVWVRRGPDRIGRRYMKARYQEYMDGGFMMKKNRSEEWEHLGLLGPVIRAVVGDTIVIHFKNFASRPYSIHPHGVFYLKDSEGSPYADDVAASTGDSVPPGGNFTYTFQVPERAGPGPNDPSSIMWIYHSHVDEIKDTNAGLFGAIIVTRQGWARADATPIDVDREFVTSLTVYDESESAYFMANIHMFLNNSNNPQFSNEWVDSLLQSSDFLDSNEKHAINGYLYANIPGLFMEVEDRVRWYTFALGSEEALHTAHWHGQTLLSYGQRLDTVQLLPSTTSVADMLPDNQGLWMYHCHVNHHVHGGMTAIFEVDPSTKPVPHTVHDEPVDGWVWLAISLILLIPMAIFGGIFAKTFQPQAPVYVFSSLPSSTSSDAASPSSPLEEGKVRSPPVVLPRAKITGFGSSRSSASSDTEDEGEESKRRTEKRGISIAVSTYSPLGGGPSTSSLSSATATSPLPSPPYMAANSPPPSSS